MSKKVEKNFVMGLNIWWSWGSGFFFNFVFKIPIGRTIFNFSCKTSGFCGGGCSFWYLFCQFFVIFEFTISVFWEAGRSFRVKKDSFFHTKLRIFGGWMLFLSKKMQDFEIFLRFLRKRSRSAKAGSLEPSVRVDPFSPSYSVKWSEVKWVSEVSEWVKWIQKGP